MKKIATCIILIAFLALSTAKAQNQQVENKPYIDLRPLHFGIHVGFHAQDINFVNVGPQTVTLPDGATATQTILCDADKWNPGLSVGVLADLRLTDYLSLRFAPTMHFGAKHLVFRNLSATDQDGNATETTQDLKNTYIALPTDLKFSAQRYGNHRPHTLAGISPMINLTAKSEDIIQLKRYDTFVEIGLGCDLYLPFFKLIPELKFCYSLSDCLRREHAGELKDENLKAYANSVSEARSKMFVLTFYFE